MNDRVEAKYKAMLNELARNIDQALNPTDRSVGFCLFLFDFGVLPGRVNYISNASRADMVKAVRDWLTRAEALKDD